MMHILTLCYVVINVFNIFVDSHEEYDYIVVGSGSTGSVIASRLSENPEVSVLLLEAGTEPPDISDVPLLPLQQLITGQTHWQYLMAPQKHAFYGFNNRSPRWLTGKVLGGTSTLNYNLYVRGNPLDFDNWAKRGAIGWSWHDVLGYFIKSEDNTNPLLKTNGFHGVDGPMTVQHSPFYSPLVKYYIGALKELGLPIGDFNSDQQESFYLTQGTLKDGKRLSSYRAFIKPVLCRKNLSLKTSAFVIKILFDEFKKASGVVYEYINSTRIALARKEIIISAGAVNSPKLLMLSGIGPYQHLSKFGIPVIADLPVGRNFHDHIGRPVISTIKKPYSFLQLTLKQLDFIKYMTVGKGRLTSLAGAELIGFIRTKFQHKAWPDIQIVLLANSLISDSGLGILTPPGNINKNVFLKAFAKYALKQTITCTPIVLRPKSRGVVLLKSKNPYDHPIIDPNYLADPDDLRILIEGMKTCFTISDTFSMKKVGTQPLDSYFPGCEKYHYASDEYLGCIAKVFAIPFYHGAGTCKMGDPADPTTVVDATLKVKGISNLRVADASIMPSVVSGNPHAAAVMIGEKAADLIKNDHSHLTLYTF